ncbi:transcription factor bHLH041-like [Musa troglodytarum]|uniref:Transcription factor bHLH041-like n=1 Tax=Musa troglodytarum TaxID=320322 RepID=A0A9E7IAU6_9LILI|nr:transcription factor bHLH041-like [Musa troglodytarum]
MANSGAIWLFQEAGIKTAVLVGCRSGEIELGMTTPPNLEMQMDIRQVFGEEFIRQWQLQSGDHLIPPPEQSWRSSSSPSLRSPSAGSPESSSLLPTKAGAAAFMPDVVLPHQMAMQTYNLMSLPSASSSPLVFQRLVLERHHPGGAFEAYHPTGARRVEATPNVAGQRMIKKGIDVLRRISTARMEAPRQEYRPTSDQLHHMISERRRRERLNQNFHALRLLLPPGSKKDKASVLAATKNYVNFLEARVSELQERNQMLELQLRPTDDADGVSDSDERVGVEISRSGGADDCNASESQQISLRLIVREECDMTGLVVRTLECLKGVSGDVTLASVAASTMSPRKYTCARFNLRLRQKAGDWDEASFKEAVTRAVADVLGRGATPSPSPSSPAHRS